MGLSSAIRKYLGWIPKKDVDSMVERGIITSVAHLFIYDIDANSDSDMDSDTEDNFNLCHREVPWNQAPCDVSYCFSAHQFPSWPQNCTIQFQTISPREKQELPLFRATFLADKLRESTIKLDFSTSYLDIYEVPDCPWKYRDAVFDVIPSNYLKSFARHDRMSLLLEGWYPSDDLSVDSMSHYQKEWREATLPECVPLPRVTSEWQCKLRKLATRIGSKVTVVAGKREWHLTEFHLELTSKPLSMFVRRQTDNRLLELNLFRSSVIEILMHHINYGRLPDIIDPEFDAVQLIQAADFYQINSLRLDAAAWLLQNLPSTITDESLLTLGQLYRFSSLAQTKLKPSPEEPELILLNHPILANSPLSELKSHCCTHCVQAPWNLLDEKRHEVYFTRKMPRIPVVVYLEQQSTLSPSDSTPSSNSRRQLQARLRKAKPMDDQNQTVSRKYPQHSIRKYVINESFVRKLG